MSLIIKRVKDISRKKRKSQSKTRTKNTITHSFEDDATKFTVIEDIYAEDFPPLRPVYRKGISGTPIVFRITNGIDYYGDNDYKVKIHSITFMREYKSKSFEELRREDYKCGRKEILHYEENSYLKSLAAKTVTKIINYEFFEPAPKNIPTALTKDKSLLSIFRTTNCSLDEIFSMRIENLPKANESLISSLQSSKSFDDLTESDRYPDKFSIFAKDDSMLDLQPNLRLFLPKGAEEKFGKGFRQRSILTYVDKLPQTLIKNGSLSKNSSDVCLNTRSEGRTSKEESIEILKTNLARFFETSEPTATMPYDFVSQNPKFYLPCAEIEFVYQNARPSAKIMEESLSDPLKATNHALSLIIEYLNLGFGNENHYKYGRSEKFEDLVERKYTCNRKLSPDYLWKKFNPYVRLSMSRKVSRAKYILAGKDIIG